MVGIQKASNGEELFSEVWVGGTVLSALGLQITENVSLGGWMDG